MKSLRLLPILGLLVSSFAWADAYSLKTTGKTYTTHGFGTMRDCEQGETVPLDARPPGYCGHDYIVKYFDLKNPADLAERETYRVVIIDGVVHHAQKSHAVYEDGDWFFVMDVHGNFYFFAKTGNTPLHHSSFFDGAPLPSAGELHIQDGKISQVTNLTGHYTITDENLENAKEAMGDSGATQTN